MDNLSSIYLSTFNMNGKDMNKSEVQNWLLRSRCSKKNKHYKQSKRNNLNCSKDCSEDCSTIDVHNADLIILSLQECPTYPAVDLQKEDGSKIPSSSCILTMGPPEIDTIE